VKLHQLAAQAQTALEPKRGLSSMEFGLLGLNVIVIAITTALLFFGWRAEVEDAERTTLATARLIERTAAQIFDKIAISADSTSDVLESQINGAGIDRQQFWPLLDKTAQRIPEVQTLGIFDANGQQVCGASPESRCRHLSVSDRPYFEAARTQKGAGYSVSGPVESRIDKQPALVLSRPLHRANGDFAGVLVALVPVRGLEEILRLVRSGDASASSLRSLQMDLLVRDPPLPESRDGHAISPELRSLMSLQPAGGVFRAKTASDGVDRISAYQRVKGWPVYALAGNAVDDVLASWRGLAFESVGFLVVVAAGSIGLGWSQRRRQAAVRHAQELFESAPCGYHTLDSRGRFVSVNATELGWLGCTADAVVKKASPRDYFTPESQAIFDQNFPELATRGRLDGLELDLVDRHGNLRHVLVSGKALYDEQGQFIGSTSVMQDVTAQRDAELQVRDLAKTQALMLDTDLVGIARLRGRNVVWANRGMTRLLGYSQDEFVGMPMRQLYLDDATFEAVGSDSYSRLQAGRFHRIEVQMRHKDGTAIWMDAGGAPLTEGAEEILMMLADLTDKKAAESMRLRAVALQAQNDQLIETGRLHDEFLANMSHEFRTPLNGILGLGQMLPSLIDAQDSARLHRFSELIMSSGAQLLSLVQAQLDYAQLEAGRLDLNPADVALPALVTGVAELYRPNAEAKEIVLSVDPESDVHNVWVDAVRLQQIISLLLDNAVKFAAPGGRVALRSFRTLSGGWCVEVKDNGLGIAPQDHERIFGKFTQLSSGVTKAFGGTGMGLPLARKLARAMGGDIVVESELGLGAVFKIEFGR